MAEPRRVLQVVEEIVIAAPPERVFRALTDPVELPRWWSDRGRYDVTEAEVDLREGGRYRLAGTSVRLGTFEVTGTYLTVDPPRRLVFTWTPDWAEAARDSRVEVRLAPGDGGTRVRLTHTGFADVGARDEHAGGWPAVLGLLARSTERPEDPPCASSARSASSP